MRGGEGDYEGSFSRQRSRQMAVISAWRMALFTVGWLEGMGRLSKKSVITIYRSDGEAERTMVPMAIPKRVITLAMLKIQ